MSLNKLKTGILTPLLAVSVFAGGATGIAALASAQTPTTTDSSVTTTTQTDAQHTHPMGMRDKGFGHGRAPGVMGTVSSVSGNTITVTKTDGTSYTIDASNAKVSKVVDLTVSDIKVGDTLGVMGQVSGTNVTATHIMDGVPPRPDTATQSQ